MSSIRAKIAARALTITLSSWFMPVAHHALAAIAPQPLAADVRFEQRLGRTVPIDARFTDERGRTATLTSFLGGRPAVLVLGYYACPNLCSATRQSLARSLAAVDLPVGVAYGVIAVSIDPDERARDATQARDAIAGDANPRGWHFLEGDSTSTRSLAESVGFHYAYDADAHQYAHPSGLVILTPEGRVSRYFFGVSYPAAELEQALVEASGERIGSPIRALLLRCFHYDLAPGRHSDSIEAAARVLGIATLGALGWLAAALARRRGSREGAAQS